MDAFLFLPLPGESIDNTFGSMLHISTMAAAGLGNLCSDVLGLGLSNSIEVRPCPSAGFFSGGFLLMVTHQTLLLSRDSLLCRRYLVNWGCRTPK
jgi:hypothetical protein